VCAGSQGRACRSFKIWQDIKEIQIKTTSRAEYGGPHLQFCHFRRQKQEDWEFEASLGYIVRSSSKQTNNNKTT
jgi:hypothetical protein